MPEPHPVKLTPGNWIAVIGLGLSALGMLSGFMLWTFQTKADARVEAMAQREAARKVAAKIVAKEHEEHEKQHEKVDRRLRAQGSMMLDVRDGLNVLIRDTGRRARPLPPSVDVEDLIGDGDTD